MNDRSSRKELDEVLAQMEAKRMAPTLEALYRDLGTLKWIGADKGWDLAIKAVRADIEERLSRAATPSEKKCIRYERRPELDKRIAHGDDFAGDAWVRWTAVGHEPEDRWIEANRQEKADG